MWGGYPHIGEMGHIALEKAHTKASGNSSECIGEVQLGGLE